MTRFEEFVACVEATTGRQGKRVGQNTRLLCPAHDDHDPSLDVAEGDQGQPLVQCRSRGCTFEQVCAAVGREPGDFLVASDAEWTPFGDAVAVYSYVDETGRLLYQVCRTADKQFPQRRPDPSAKSGWRWKLDDTRRVLYRLDRIAAAAAEGFPEPVYVVEGEKDVHALERAGALATCNPGGAGKWTQDCSLELLGARVLIVADLDEAGIGHARQVAASLAAASNGVPALVEILQPARGKDAADHVAAGLGLADLVPLAGDAPLAPTALRVVALADFVAVTEDTAAPLIGTADEMLLPANGLLLMYGDGGAGKTVLTVDAAAHLASGTEWLGNPVGGIVRCLLIENEGPRGPFRQMLGRKRDGWQGAEFSQNVHVLEEPWTRFTLSNHTYRLELAAQIDATETDLVMVGPLASIGTKGGGTPDEITEFGELVADLRALTERAFALWIVHHENKAGDVSGAWERVPDTLVHVSNQGNGRTRVNWRKARWASTLHNTSLNLLWAENAGFHVETAKERDYAAELTEAFTADNRWRTLTETAGLIAANKDYVREHLSALVESDLFTYAEGPPGRKPNAKCWALRTAENLFTTGSEASEPPRAS